VNNNSQTAYARLTPLQARGVLASLLLASVFSVAVTLSPLASSNPQKDLPRPGDVALYRAEVARIHAGEGYYAAAAAELTARGYPTRSVFNWRTPLPIWLLGKLPWFGLGRALLGGLALALLVLAFDGLAREEGNDLTKTGTGSAIGSSIAEAEPPFNAVPVPVFIRLHRPILCALLLTGPLLPTILGDLCVLPVLWAGVLIALSVCMYGIHRPYWGVALGIAALFFRELALPYVVLAAALAWHDRRRGELLALMIGLAAWLVFFGLHWLHVRPLIAPHAVAHREGWIQFGGAAFVLSTMQMNAYLLLLPQWVAALYFTAAMFGFAGWHTPLGTRIGLSTCLFVAAFAVVGQNFNQYWGSLIAPLLCFGVARFPSSLCDLWRAARASAACT
jgi:hypothetical protein